MGFVGSYLWRLRQKVGSDLVLMPGRWWCCATARGGCC